MSSTRADLPNEIPPELNRWNWGAFLLTWIWGIGNGVFISLLVFIPFLGILIMPFVLGAKGSAWAWKKGRWDSVEHFRRVQRLWAIWGAVLWLALIGLFVLLFGGIFFALSQSDAYKLGTEGLKANADVVEALGQPLSFGFPNGNVSVQDGSGEALLTFSVTGPKGSGQAAVQAHKSAGAWKVLRLKLELDAGHRTIDIVGGDGAWLEPAAPFSRSRDKGLPPGLPRGWPKSG